MSMNLHHLRLFAAVAQRQSFSAAAESLNITQPAVSKALADLERQIGLPLLDRSGRTVQLTEAGDVLFARARELFGIEQAAERELLELKGLRRGMLRVGASTTVATYLLPQVFSSFRERHPNVQ